MSVPKPKIQEARERISSGIDFLVKLGIRELEKPQYRNDPEAWELIGHGYAHRHKFAKAQDAFLMAHELTQEPYYLGLYAAAKLCTDEPGHAVGILEKMIADGAAAPRFYVDLAKHYVFEEHPEDALRILDAGLAIRRNLGLFPTFKAIKVLAYLAVDEEERARQEALSVISGVLGKEYTSFAAVPLSVEEGLLQRLSCGRELAKIICAIIIDWIQHALNPELPGVDVFDDDLAFWDQVVDQEVRPEIEAVEHTKETAAVTMQLFQEMETFRKEVNTEAL